MEKVLCVQSNDTKNPNIIIRNGVSYNSFERDYYKVFDILVSLRRETRQIYHNGNLTVSCSKGIFKKNKGFYITGNFVELDSLKRRIAFKFYAQGIAKCAVVDELVNMSSSKGYSLSETDINTIRNIIDKKSDIINVYLFLVLAFLLLIFFYTITLWN